MNRISRAGVPLARAAVLLLCIQSGCWGCGTPSDDRCSGFECNEAICQGDTVFWCPCDEDADGGVHSWVEEADCAASGEHCVVASDGTDGSLREALCLDSCDVPGAHACLEGAEGPLYVCTYYDYDPYGDAEPAGPHYGYYTYETHPDSTYEDLLEWAPVEEWTCTSCTSTCGCDGDSQCREGLCVPGEHEEGLVCCEGGNGDPCTTGSACENADGSQGVCE